MKRHLVLIWLAVAFIFLGGAVFPIWADQGQEVLPLGSSNNKYLIDKIEKDQIMDTASGEIVTIADIIEQNQDTDVFIIGEAHDNYQCHTFQRDFIEALYKKHPKLVIGFEFFWREDNPVLQLWLNGQIDEQELLNKTGWYERGAINFGYTRLVMDIIKNNKIEIIGLNVSRAILRTISRKGFAQLTEDERALFPTLNIPNPEHEYFIKYIFGVFAVQVPMWFKNVYSAQVGWDVVMAESMRHTLAKKEMAGFKGVIIAGSNHVAYKLGIPFRYLQANPKVKITTIVPVLLPAEKQKDDNEEESMDMHPMMKAMGKSLPPASPYSRGIADYVFSAEQPLDAFFPVIGFTVEEQQGRWVITQVSKKSLAEKNGLKIGDIINHMDGIEIKTLEQLRTLIAQKNWDDSISLNVEKKIELKKEQ